MDLNEVISTGQRMTKALGVIPRNAIRPFNAKPEEATYLNLFMKGLQELPDSVSIMLNLESINLDKNQLRYIPDFISILTNLRVLKFSYNLVSYIPDWISLLKKLEEIMCFENEITALPETISLLTSLKRLNVASEVNFSQVPDVLSVLTGLENIEINFADTTPLPDWLFNVENRMLMQSLRINSSQTEKVLDIDFLHFDKIRTKDLPTSISRVSNLRALKISNCGITNIPPEILSSKITNIHMSGNKELTFIPDSIFELTFLEKASLYCNSISAIPDSISNLTRLKSLLLQGNQISVIPDAVSHLTNLVDVALGQNKIVDLPSWVTLPQFYYIAKSFGVHFEPNNQIHQCTSLKFQSPDITCLPESISLMKNIVIIGNYGRKAAFPKTVGLMTQITNIQIISVQMTAVPDVICELHGLKCLDLSQNKLSELPPSFSSLTQLETLRIGMNKFREIPPVVRHMNDLSQFFIDQNHISELPEFITELKKLRFLRLEETASMSISNDVKVYSILHLNIQKSSNHHISTLST